MKKWILSGFIISALGLSACSNDAAVMKSDAGNISQDELYQTLKDKYGDQTLQQLMIEKVLSSAYKVSDSEIDKQLNKSKEQLGDQFLTTIQQYGYADEEDFRNSVKLNLLEQKAVYKTIKVTDKELKDAYAAYKPEVQARHILVDDENTAKEIEDKLKKGAKFEDLAKESSKDTATASNGGDLGWFGTGEMDPDFEDAAYKLKVNEISEPIQTQYGYHIIQVTGIKDKGTFEELKSTLTDQVKESKVTQDIVMTALKDEFKKANVKISDDDLKEAAEFSTTTPS